MYKAKVAEQTFEFEFSHEKALEGTLNGEAFKMDTAQQGDVHHVLHKHGSYKVKMVRFDKENKTCVIQGFGYKSKLPLPIGSILRG